MNKSFVKILSLMMMFCCSFSVLADDFADSLGLTLLPVANSANDKASAKKPPLVIFMSGDGGWANLDQGVSQLLQQQGWPVVGWSSLKYYWKQKDPKDVTQDTMDIIDKYEAEFGTQ